MASKDLKSNISMKVLHVKAQKTATASIVGDEIADFRGACFLVDIGTYSADGLTVTLQESDNNSDWTDIADTDLDFNGQDVSANDIAIVTGLANSQIYVGYHGSKKYIGAVITDAADGDAVVGVYLLKGYPKALPQNA